MELSMMLDYAGDPRRAADQAAALESAGLDAVWVAEAWGFDSTTIMGYLAARTERLKIGSAILNVYSRTPGLIAQTAAGLDALSGGRALLCSAYPTRRSPISPRRSLPPRRFPGSSAIRAAPPGSTRWPPQPRPARRPSRYTRCRPSPTAAPT